MSIRACYMCRMPEGGFSVNMNIFLRTATALLLFTATSAVAQLNSGTGAAVTLNATVAESLTVSLDRNAISFALTPGSASNSGNTGLNITTAWNLASGRSAVKLYAYFSNPTEALTNGTNSIPAANVSVSVGGGGALSLDSSIPSAFGSIGAVLVDTAITSANQINLTGTQSPVALNIDLSSTPTLPAGTYSGTLHFQAQATL